MAKKMTQQKNTTLWGIGVLLGGLAALGQAMTAQWDGDPATSANWSAALTGLATAAIAAVRLWRVK
jgi:hypothetical protein